MLSCVDTLKLNRFSLIDVSDEHRGAFYHAMRDTLVAKDLSIAQVKNALVFNVVVELFATRNGPMAAAVVSAW